LNGEYIVNESRLQAKLLAYVRNAGMVGYKVEATSVVGFPDLFIAGHGRVELWEVKHPDKSGRLRSGQVRRIAELRDAGVTVRVIDGYETGKKVVDLWRPNAPAAGEH
jgi:hypothetical protein